jgi:hypothetical protein
MTTMTSPHTNGRKRPSLSEQINRLDGILDGLSDGLNDAVADAVQAAVGLAVKEAVQTVLKELLANPAIVAKLHPPGVPLAAEPLAAPAPASPTASERLLGWWQRARAYLAAVRENCREPMQRLRTYLGGLWQKVAGPVTALWHSCDSLRPFKRQIWTAVCIGLLMAILACYASPWISAIVSGIGGFVTTLAIQVGLWLRNLGKANDAEEMA